MRGPSIDHVLMTRFNVPTPGREGLIRAQDGWLKSRIELFEKYCNPSIQSQTLQNFHWLIYFDPDSPPWLKKWLVAQADHRRFYPVFRTAISRDELISDLKDLTGAHGNILVTTNLDNDDGLACDFVERLQNSISSDHRAAIYFTTGIILKGTNSYLRSDPRNAFCSVAESWKEPVTAWADWHNRLSRTMPVTELAGAPAWLQVIHERNVSNTVHGQLCNPSQFSALFPFGFAELSDPSRIRLLTENNLLRPIRGIRACLRSSLKWAILTTLGKGRFDAIKNYSALYANRARALLARAKNPKWSQAKMESED